MNDQNATLSQLSAFLEVAQRRSIQAAARASGRSRATYMRALADLRRALDAPELLQRAPGQRTGVLTPAGEELARRAESLLRHVQQWHVATRDALGERQPALRVGAIAGSFDLIADILADLRAEAPEVSQRITEYPDETLLQALDAGDIDLAFGAQAPAPVRSRWAFVRLGSLPWAVVVPASMADAFGDPVRLVDLDGVPMVVLRGGPARRRLEEAFAGHADGPLFVDAACEVGSTPRVVQMVARGFGPAVVSRFRLSFLPAGVEVRTLIDGPPPLSAGAYARRGAPLTEIQRALLDRARTRFSELQ
ncbi:MAG: LysR family transcriptional regulator [Myxococcota bacterium]